MKILKYLDGLFCGRIGRINYFLGLVFFAVILYVFTFVLNYIFSFGNASFGNSAPYIILYISIFVVFYITLVIYVVSLIIRRLHDMGMKGWWILVLFFVPIGNIIIALMLLAGPGQKEINQYGEIPTGNNFFSSVFNIKLNPIV